VLLNYRFQSTPQRHSHGNDPFGIEELGGFEEGADSGMALEVLETTCCVVGVGPLA